VDNKKSGFQSFLEFFGYIIVVVILIVYVFWGALDVVDKQKTIQEIILTGAVAWILGFSISRILERQGVIHGGNNPSVLKANNIHADEVEKVYPFIDECDDWCAFKNKNALFIKREKLLRKNGLKYATYFDKEGDFIPGSDVFPEPLSKIDAKLQKKKKKVIENAVNCTITPLTTSTLTTSYTGDDYDPFNFGQGLDSFLSKSAWKDVVSKLATAIIFGYYALKLATDFAWGDLIWTSIQASTFLAFGFVKELSVYFYITNTCKVNTYRKVDKLKEFEVWHGKKGVE
jgi:hypothetical protein